MATPLAIRVSARGFQGGGETWANVWHVRDQRSINPTTIDADQAQDIADTFRTFYAAAANVDRHNAWTLDEVVVTDLREAEPVNHPTEIVQLVGGSSGVPATYDVAIAATLATALNTRRGRGRVFLNGWVSSSIHSELSDGSPAVPSALRNTLLDALQALQAGLGVNVTNGPFALGVLSTADNAIRPVTSVRIGNRHDTQRRRGAQLVEAFSVRNIPPAP